MVKRETEPNPEPAVRLQYAALPYRLTEAGDLEIMLITSRKTRRWIVPKGWPMKNRTPSEAAAVEAFEEAGVRGAVRRRALGTFRYDKFLDDEERWVPCDVTVFALRVERQHGDWPEREQRDVRWLSPGQAGALVADAGLRELIEAFGARHRARRPVDAT